MKWDRDHIDLFELPQLTKDFLVEEGVDAWLLLYEAEFCECFLWDDQTCCIGRIQQAACVIERDGKLNLYDQDGNVIPLATSITKYAELNQYLQEISFDENVDWNVIVSELTQIDEVILISTFWSDLLDHLNQF